MKIQTKLFQCLLILFSVVNIAYTNDIILKNDTRYAVSVSPWFKNSEIPRTPFIFIGPGQKQKITSVNLTQTNDLIGIIVTYPNEWEEKTRNRQGAIELGRTNFVPMWVNQNQLDTLQHQAAVNGNFPITYALKVGWTAAYYTELIPPFQ